MLIDAPSIQHVTYATCYNLSGIMADGSRVRPHSAASNVLPLGTRIRLVGRKFYGIRNFVIRDMGGALGDGHLDLWRSGGCAAWGVRSVKFVIVR